MTNHVDLSAKLSPPVAAGLKRARLLEGPASRVRLISAPAGHGKTTLLAHLAEGFDGTVAWYRLDPLDRRPQCAVAGIYNCLQRTSRRAGARHLPDGTSFGDLADSLGQGCPGENPTLLVLDDFHEVVGSPTERELERFVAIAVTDLYVAIGTRPVAALGLNTLSPSDAISVIGPDDLRFRSWEVESLFRDVYHEPLAPADAARLSRQLEGWAAGLAMFHLLVTGRSPLRRHEAISELGRGSRLVRSYLVREVLADLPDRLREFLRSTSALHLMTGPLCDALLGTTGSQQVLEELEQRGLFTSSDDDGHHFRYHQVLQDHLELELTEMLGDRAARTCYARAAELLMSAGEPQASFRAWVRAEEWARVEQLLAERGAEVIASSLGDLTQALPGALVAHDPWILLAQARRLISRGSLAKAVDVLRQAQAAADNPQVADVCADQLRSVTQWLPTAGAARQGWGGIIRAATRRPPRQPGDEPAAAISSAQEALAWGLAAFAGGDIRRAGDLLATAARHHDAGTAVVATATCAGAALRLLCPDGSPFPEGSPFPDGSRFPVAALEAAVLDLELLDWPWLSRLGRAVLKAHAGDCEGLLELLDEADQDGDHWGAALITWLRGTALRSASTLRDAERRFAALDAPVPALWCAGMAWHCGPRGAGGPDPGALASIRALGLQAVLPVVQRWATRPPSGDQRAAPPAPPAPRTALAGAAAAPTAAGSRRGRPEPYQVRMLGGFEFSLGGAAVAIDTVRPRVRSTLRLLALRAGTLVHRDQLIETLWPGTEPSASLRSLQVAVSSLRGLLDRSGSTPGLIRRLGESYVLTFPPGARSDLQDFERQLSQAGRSRSAADHARERIALEAALAVYGGDLLPEEGLAEWVLPDRQRLHLLAAAAAERLARCQRLDGQLHAAVQTTWRCLDLDGYRDSAWRLLVELYRQSGDETAARAAQGRHDQVLAELGFRSGNVLALRTDPHRKGARGSGRGGGALV